jgi:hypothetical protein
MISTGIRSIISYLIQNYNAMIYLSKLFLFILDYIIYDIILVKKTRKVEKNHIICDIILLIR